MAPGIQVAQIDSNKWAITARGFNRQYSNKLLVLFDGRSVYTPTFSGVYWDSQDYVLEDIDRGEVVRGPGGTLWGENCKWSNKYYHKESERHTRPICIIDHRKL